METWKVSLTKEQFDSLADEKRQQIWNESPLVKLVNKLAETGWESNINQVKDEWFHQRYGMVTAKVVIKKVFQTEDVNSTYIVDLSFDRLTDYITLSPRYNEYTGHKKEFRFKNINNMIDKLNYLFGYFGELVESCVETKAENALLFERVKQIDSNVRMNYGTDTTPEFVFGKNEIGVQADAILIKKDDSFSIGIYKLISFEQAERIIKIINE